MEMDEARDPSNMEEMDQMEYMGQEMEMSAMEHDSMD